MKQMKITIPQLLLFDNTTVKKNSLNDKRLCGQSMKNQFAGTQLCGSRLSGGGKFHTEFNSYSCKDIIRDIKLQGGEGE